MLNFAIVTRGRTGSTAVIDELGKVEQLCTTQELFRKGPYTDKLLKNHYKLISPYDHWKQRVGWLKGKFPNSWLAFHYLKYAEDLAKKQGSEIFGFKILSHHFEERKYIKYVLKGKKYKIIYLRRNTISQVLSGIIANLRGIWNRQEEVVDDKKYYIDIDEFKWHVQFARQCVRKDCHWLSSEGFDYIKVSYEDFCSDRKNFYANIFKFLNLPIELPPMCDYVKVIKDLKFTIKNYDEVSDAAASFGEEI
jgi:LPS sulfotransferase NodH